MIEQRMSVVVIEQRMSVVVIEQRDECCGD